MYPNYIIKISRDELEPEIFGPEQHAEAICETGREISLRINQRARRKELKAKVVQFRLKGFSFFLSS